MLKHNKSTLSDNEIISSILNKHKIHLYEILYARYYKKVLDKCYSFLKNRQLAEDAAGDVLSKAYEKLDSLKRQPLFRRGYTQSPITIVLIT
jgi:DNA-directed RNA polymerase specialized sigma24 family protein